MGSGAASISAAARGVWTCSTRNKTAIDELHASRRLQARGRRFSPGKLIASCSPRVHRPESRLPSGCIAPSRNLLSEDRSMSAGRSIPNSTLACRIACPCLVCLGVAAGTLPASAFRPFDGTDAAVVHQGRLEIELQPAGLLKDVSGTNLVAPAVRFNYGFAKNWEAVWEGQIETPLSPSGPTSLQAAGAFLKTVLREGSLQNKTGPSIATEFGVLLPDSRDSSGTGASLAGIVS